MRVSPIARKVISVLGANMYKNVFCGESIVQEPGALQQLSSHVLSVEVAVTHTGFFSVVAFEDGCGAASFLARVVFVRNWVRFCAHAYVSHGFCVVGGMRLRECVKKRSGLLFAFVEDFGILPDCFGVGRGLKLENT